MNARAWRVKRKVAKIMGLLKEFKDFAFKGNVMDMAVGVIIGGAFTAVVSGVTEQILNPILDMVFGHITVEDWIAGLSGNVSGLVNAIITFLLTALVLFLIIKGIATAEAKAAALVHKEEEAPAPTTKVCPFCKSEIPVEATKCAHCTSDVE